jgi:hypothetical protein
MRRADVTPPEDDAELFVAPPGAEAVARRAAILTAVVVRGVTELEDNPIELPYFDELRLDRDAEPEELELMRAPHGTLARLLTAHWRVRQFMHMTQEPITRADPDLVHATSSILTERRLAVSWLQGYDALYSEGDTST